MLRGDRAVVEVGGESMLMVVVVGLRRSRSVLDAAGEVGGGWEGE